jgi:uncharacterized Zn finger protein (UPF0148 family)
MLIGLMQIAVTGNGNPTEDLPMHDEHDDEFEDEDEDELDEHGGEYQEFDVCPYCGTLLNELNGRVECPNCGEGF